MTPTEQLHWMICRKSAHDFIFGLDTGNGIPIHFVYTKDEHDKENAKKPFPDLPYLRVILDHYLVGGRFISPDEAIYAIDWGIKPRQLEKIYRTGLFAIEKSRQVMVTWLSLAYVLWRAKFLSHQLCLVQSKREDDVKLLVCTKEDEMESARLTFMEMHLPPYMRSISSASKCNVFFTSGSRVWGIPQGGNIIRSHTPSLLFSDEAAFQPEFGEAYTAALPAVRGGGQAIFVSTPEPGAFQEIVEAKAI